MIYKDNKYNFIINLSRRIKVLQNIEKKNQFFFLNKREYEYTGRKTGRETWVTYGKMRMSDNASIIQRNGAIIYVYEYNTAK